MSILEIQKALKAAGFDPGKLDGIDGPKTHAALMAFQKAKGLSSDPAAWDKTQAALGGGAPAPATADPTAAATQQKYPQFGWLYGDPELGPLLRQAASEGWSIDALEGKIQQTNWWKTHSADARSYLELAATDPAETTRLLNNYDSIQKYITNAAAYGVKVSFESAAGQVDRVVRGEVAPDALTQELRNMAKNLYGWDTEIGKAIDQGQTVADVFEPYKQIAVSTLGLNPASVRLDDPKWNSLLHSVDDATGKRLPTQAEVAKRLRTDPTYGFSGSQSGRDEAFAAVNAVSDAFGFGKVA